MDLYQDLPSFERPLLLLLMLLLLLSLMLPFSLTDRVRSWLINDAMSALESSRSEDAIEDVRENRFILRFVVMRG